MPWWVHTAVGLCVVGALAAAAWRAAGRVAPGDPVLRLLAAVVLWWLGAQLSALATRLPLPGGTPVLGSVAALVLAAVAVGAAGRGARPGAPGHAPPDDGAGPGILDPATRAVLLGVGAGLVALIAVTLARPVVGFDGLLYHLALPAAWVPQDALAGLPHVVTGLPVEAYPVGMEVVLGWLVAVTGSTATAVLLSPLALATLIVAVWTAARRLGAGVAAAWGAVASVAFALPALVDAGQLHSDVLSTALMACGVALAVEGSARLRTAGGPASADPLLLGACAVLLAVGVKTTAACGVLLVLLLAVPHRRAIAARLASRRAWVVLLLLALGCGGAWSLRNLVLHGHPSWPLLATSFGDPVPPLLARVDGRFADDPLGVLRVGGDAYLRLAWIVAPLLLAGLVGAWRGRGPHRALAVCGVLGALAWTVAPATGITSDADLAAGAVRYLLPCWTLLALAAWSWPADGARARRAVRLLLGAVLLVQAVLALAQASRAGTTLHVMPLRAVLVAVAVGAAVWGVAVLAPARAAAVAGVRDAGVAPRRGATVLVPLVAAARSRGGAVLVALVLAAGLLAATPGFWSRHADALGEAVPPVPTRPVVALGGTPAWSLGPHGRPGSVLVGDCAAVLRRHAAGRTVAVSTSGTAGRCTLPGVPSEIDGFRVWGPAAPGR